MVGNTSNPNGQQLPDVQEPDCDLATTIKVKEGSEDCDKIQEVQVCCFEPEVTSQNPWGVNASV